MNNKNRFYKIIAVVAAAMVFMIGGPLFLNDCAKKPKIYRVGILSGLDFFTKTAAGFKEKMAEMGYVEGKNIVYDHQKSNIDAGAYKKILTKFIADKVDLIFVFPTEASIEAKAIARGTTIPVLFADAIIEETGLINSMTNPGENITGVRWPGPDLAVKILEIMRKIAPRAKKIWLPYQKGYPTIVSQLKALHSAAAISGVTLIEAPVSNLSELRARLDSAAGLKKPGMDAIMNIPEPLSGTPEGFLTMCVFAQKHSLPIGGTLNSIEGCESLFGVNVDHFTVGKQAAILADKILSGVPAGSIRVVSAEIYIQINYREIKKMGLKADEGLLSSANEVIR
jgi:putative tryptophan/tyrosine transport system substrate-binding protein